MNTTPSSAPNATPRGRIVPAIARVLLGLPLVVFGMNAFLHFIPPPPPETMPPEAMAFSAALMATGYMMPLIGVTQVAVGLALLANRFAALALVVLTPFLVNALAFHVALERSGLPAVAVFIALTAYLAWVHRAAYRPILRARLSDA